MQSFPPLPEWISLEHSVARILTQQEIYGWYFDEVSARELECSLRNELEKISQVLRDRHPYVGRSEFTPKRNNRTSGYHEGCPFTRIAEFNPTSRDHIAWILQEIYNWNPSQWTKTGKPIIDETILTEIGTEFSTMCAKALDLTKKLGMLSEGMNAWQKLSTKSSRIHHHCSVNTNTHRCAHRKPNLAQTPSESEFRRLFTATPGMVMVGADLSGIELRMLAHYLARYDSGRYADILVNGDIHQVNADKIGISRKLVKTVTYAFLYGAGDRKIGLSYDKNLSPEKAAAKGAEIRKAYVNAISGLDQLLRAIKARAADGYVKSIDGRKVLVDSSHKALNYLLQSGAGVVAKRWMVIANQQKLGNQLAFIHDELQFETTPEKVNDLRFNLELSAKLAGEYYKLRCPIAAESSCGKTWADTH